MKALRLIGTGLAGALGATAAHQAFKATVPNPPRMDVLGMRGIERLADHFGLPIPTGKKLFNSALVGDIISNTLFYSPVANNRGMAAYANGVTMGVMAGVGAIKLPEKFGMGRDASAMSTKQMALTIAIYVAGGLAAATAANILPSEN